MKARNGVQILIPPFVYVSDNRISISMEPTSERRRFESQTSSGLFESNITKGTQKDRCYQFNLILFTSYLLHS
jgi:hypothetical protein